MDLRQLRHFVAIFERGNLSKAAEDIFISQPALTRSLKTLEDELGVELLQRHARGTTPTEAGERFYHHAMSILAECSRARLDAAQMANGELVGEVAQSLEATVLMVTHDPADAKRFADKVVLVADGVAAAPVDTNALFANPSEALRRYMG